MHMCMRACVHVHRSRGACMPWHMSRGQRKFSRVSPGLLPCLRPCFCLVCHCAHHATWPTCFQEFSCLPLHLASEAMRLLVCTIMSDLTWVLRSRTQVLKPAWHVLYPRSHPPSLRTFFFKITSFQGLFLYADFIAHSQVQDHSQMHPFHVTWILVMQSTSSGSLRLQFWDPP